MRCRCIFEPVIDRLMASAKLHRRPFDELVGAVRAFDVQRSNVELCRKSAVALLTANGVPTEDANDTARAGIAEGDFLLLDHELASADFVVGNPPYIRLEGVANDITADYRRACATMRGRADIYVGFIERGLQLLRDGGRLGFICADRWMHNQYGVRLRELVSRSFAVETVAEMHDVNAFEEEVSAYPAVIVISKSPQGAVNVVQAGAGFGPSDASAVVNWSRNRQSATVIRKAFTATRLQNWFTGGDLWPTGSPSQLAVLRDLEKRFPPLEDPATGTRVGIGGLPDVMMYSSREYPNLGGTRPATPASGNPWTSRVAWRTGRIVT